MNDSYFIPENTRVYAIGDIHGMVTLLNQMHEKIAIDMVTSPVETPVIIYLGDYIDSGEDNYQVLETLIHRQSQEDGVKRIFLKGNHEDAMLRFLKDPVAGLGWLDYGGDKTMRDYGVNTDRINSVGDLQGLAEEFKAAVPQAHLNFLKSLETFNIIGDYCFVHAGIRPGKTLENQNPEDLLYIREPFLNSTELFSKRIIHAHTPVKKPDIKPNRINVDTGAVYGGDLSCAVLEKDTVRILSVNNDI